MFKLLAKKFIKDKDDLKSSSVRTAYGTLCGAMGIFFNIFLFATKLIAGIISGSISIMADSFNNLSDAGSSIITIIGFKLSNQKPDTDHPFGHGRIEYLSGLLVSVLIIVMGFELGKSSVEKIIRPETPDYPIAVLIILAISILVKFYMFLYNRYVGKLIESETVRAAALDSLCDMASTAAVFICALICIFTKINLDAYCGLVVAVIIFKTGFSSIISTINPLLGQAPEQSFVDEIKDIVMAHNEIIGIHDLVVHDYGPGRMMISLHAEVPAQCEILEMHDTIDNIEHELKNKLNCEAVIHMDPIMNNDEFTNSLKSMILDIIGSIDPIISIHDFRVVSGATHTNLIFDVVIPFSYKMSDTELVNLIKEKVSESEPTYFCVINVDKSTENR